MPNCLDKKRNEIIAQGEYYPIFDGYGMHSDIYINIAQLSKLDIGSSRINKFDNADFVNYSWWKVIYQNGHTGSTPIVNIANIERIED